MATSGASSTFSSHSSAAVCTYNLAGSLKLLANVRSSPTSIAMVASLVIALVWYRTYYIAASLIMVGFAFQQTGKKAAVDPQGTQCTKRMPTRPGSPSRQDLLAQHKQRTGVRQHLLQPVKDCNKLTVVLDLDETLLCAYRLKGLAPELAARHLQRPIDPHAASLKLHLQCNISPGTLERLVVYLRPGVEAFLDRLASFAEVVLFTAGVQGYAEPLVRAIDPEGHRFSAVLYRPATVQTRSRDYVKDLEALGRNMARVVLVDNNPLSFMLQPLNGVPVEPYAGDPTDTFLLDVLLPLLHGLAHLPDVRPVLDSKFGMVQWFRGRGLKVHSPLPTQQQDLYQSRLAYALGGSIACQYP